MKKFYLILAALAAFTFTAQAEEGVLTIGDYDNATDFVSGSYFDIAPTNFYLAHTGAQMIITADNLADFEGKEEVKINKISYRFYSETFEGIQRNVKLYIQESDESEFAVIEGVKQFFNFDIETPTVDTDIDIDFIDVYGEDSELEFELETPFEVTPGKNLIVTIVFDAYDDDNCTMGSDYVTFYNSGIRSHVMTYTDNWNSFIDYAQGNDFPDARAALGCGTNVDMPVTKIEYTYTEAEETREISGGVCDTDGNPLADVTVTAVAVDAPQGIIRAQGEPLTTKTDVDGYYTLVVPADAEYNVTFEKEGYETVTVPEIEAEYVEMTPVTTGVSNVSVTKAVASVKYYNAAGVASSEAFSGVNIVVTKYADGTQTVTKIVK